MAAFGKRNVAAFAPRGAVQSAAPAVHAFSQAAPVTRAPSSAAGSPASAFNAPFVTIGILALLCGIFYFQVHTAPVLFSGYSLSAAALTGDGAVSGKLVFQDGQWWRLLTAPLLHASRSHLIGNAVVFAVIGFMLEPKIGWRWFAGLFVMGAIGGSFFSVLLNPPQLPSVGASGAIVGVLAAAVLCGSSARSGPKGRRMQVWALRLVLPALIPLATNSHVDYACHLGGVLAGLLTGVVMLMGWERGEDHPAFGELGAAIGGIGLAAGLIALVLGAQTGKAAVVSATPAGLMPETEAPDFYTVDTDKARDLVARYPHDPRAHLMRGFTFLKYEHDLADAEEQFREALDPEDMAAAQTTDDFRKEVTVLLALTISYENRPDEARAMGAPLCGFAADAMGNLMQNLRDRGICS